MGGSRQVRRRVSTIRSLESGVAMVTEIPDDVVRALDGLPIIGTYEPMIPLLTTDGKGYPHVCLLSRAEVTADNQNVLVYVTSPHTAVNLRERGQATLMVITSETAYYCKLQVERQRKFGSGIACCFRAVFVKRDGIGVGLQPARYWVDPTLPIQERWDESAAALQSIADR
jgi:hypothetical protein